MATFMPSDALRSSKVVLNFALLVASVSFLCVPYSLLSTPLRADSERPQIYLLKGYTGSSSSRDGKEFETTLAWLQSKFPEVYSRAEFYIYDYSGNREGSTFYRDISHHLREFPNGPMIAVGFSAGTIPIKRVVEQSRVTFLAAATIEGADPFSTPRGKSIIIDFLRTPGTKYVENWIGTSPYIWGDTEHTVGPNTVYISQKVSVSHPTLLKYFAFPPSGQSAVGVDGLRKLLQHTFFLYDKTRSSGRSGVESKPLTITDPEAFSRFSHMRYWRRREN